MLSLLRGSVRRTVAVGLVLLVAVAGGAFAVGVLGAPTVMSVDNRFAGVNATTTVIETDLVVDNPNPAGVSLGGVGVEYAVAMNDVRLAHGTKDGIAVKRGETAVPFVSHVDNQKIPDWWVSHVENGEHTELTVDATVRSSALGQSFGGPTVRRNVDTDIVGQFNSTETRPINANSPLVADPVLYVNETSASWGDVSESTTPIRLAFTVYNPKPHPVAFSELGYDITMNGVDVGEGATAREYVIPPESSRTIETTTYIDNDRIDEWWVTHLERNQTTDLRIEFYAKLGVGGGSTIRVPLDALTYTQTVETDIFGTKNETASASTATPTGDETPSDGAPERPTDGATTAGTTTGGGLFGGSSEATATATETAAPTATRTATETSAPDGETATDDGGLLDVGR